MNACIGYLFCMDSMKLSSSAHVCRCSIFFPELPHNYNNSFASYLALCVLLAYCVKWYKRFFVTGIFAWGMIEVIFGKSI